MVEQVDRDAAWPFRPEGYGPFDKPAWDAGTYDDMPAGEAIRAFRAHRIAAEARGMEKAAQIAEGPCSLIASTVKHAKKLIADEIRAALNGGQHE